METTIVLRPLVHCCVESLYFCKEVIRSLQNGEEKTSSAGGGEQLPKEARTERRGRRRKRQPRGDAQCPSAGSWVGRGILTGSSLRNEVSGSGEVKSEGQGSSSSAGSHGGSRRRKLPEQRHVALVSSGYRRTGRQGTVSTVTWSPGSYGARKERRS